MLLKRLLDLLYFLGFFGFGIVKGVVARGTTVHLNVDGSPTNFVKIGNVTQFSGPGGQGTVIDASNLDSVAREKLMGLIDEGQFTFTVNLDPDDTGHLALKTARRNKTLCEFKVTLTDTSPKLLVFFGYVLGFQPSGGLDQLVQAAVTVEIDGEVNWV